MSDAERIPLLIPDEEAQKFIIFQKHWDLFNILESENALQLGWGKVIINFAFGKVQTVVKEEVVFKRGSYPHSG